MTPRTNAGGAYAPDLLIRQYWLLRAYLGPYAAMQWFRGVQRVLTSDERSILWGSKVFLAFAKHPVVQAEAWGAIAHAAAVREINASLVNAL